MTSYITPSVKTKKALKEMKGKSVTVIEPTIFNGDLDMIHPLAGIAIVGPGPYDRKWFAQIWTDSEGKLTKVT